MNNGTRRPKQIINNSQPSTELHQLKSYIKFLLSSQNQHGIHSPFVYDLVTNCFYDKKKHPGYELLENYRKDLLKNQNHIKVRDFGAGSRVFKSDKREISTLAKKVGISGKRAKLLYRLSNYLHCRDVMELGTSLGIGTSALAANKDIKVTTIEGCPETAKIAKQQFEKFRLKNIDLQVGEFLEVLDFLVKREETRDKSKKSKLKNDRTLATDNPQLITNTPKSKTRESFDMVYFDGNHQKEPTLNYFHKLLPSAHNDSIFVFDDIHWSADMELAWAEIKKHPSVKVTIDTFYLGLVFFRKEQAKQHFKIRL